MKKIDNEKKNNRGSGSNRKDKEREKKNERDREIMNNVTEMEIERKGKRKS